ncbi:FKBP-type peptidyl-prolyl cis-trans isomerase, partial [Franconibacter helveticus]|uniref:FKBP-type peptidyl-prolyl cis-trans isomerase n=1 Tax=Franconibacter helveticus TaxID=357240 RepID=UPI00290C536E
TASQQEAQAMKAQIATLSSAQDAKTQESGKLQARLLESQKKTLALEKEITVLTTAQADSTQSSEKMAQQVQEEQKKAAALAKQVAELTASQSGNTAALAMAEQNLVASQKKSSEFEKKWQEASKQLEEKNKQLASLDKAKPATAAKPKSTDEIRDYALGAFWAQEMIGMMKSKEGYGYHIARQQVLNGATDMINGELKLSYEQLIKVLQELDKNSGAQEEKVKKIANNEGRQYMTGFSKQPGVKKASMGYYYLIAKKGSGKIKNSDTVGVVIRESLSNGKIINDMTQKGTVLALPLNSYPPLFKSALSVLNNHGEIRIVVPPELAYGEAGRMPEIPPDSTMVYDIKIVDVAPTGGQPASANK